MIIPYFDPKLPEAWEVLDKLRGLVSSASCFVDIIISETLITHSTLALPPF